MKILTKIKPSKWERNKINRLVSNFFETITPILKDAQPILAGSIAKDTWLSGSHDVDLFIRFPYEKYKDKDISIILEKRLERRKLKFKVVHGSRDYFQTKKRGYYFELIPVLDIEKADKARNITDVSPLHAEWVINHNKQPDQIRLIKQFTKAQGLYGAESYIGGFSGYVLEVLTIYYKTFFDLVKHASNWESPVVIDPNNYYKDKEEVLSKLNKDKHASLILIDPVQASRNAAAALYENKFEKFVKVCREFMKNPKEDYFKETKFSIKKIREVAGENKIVLYKVESLKGKKDIVGSKLLKAFVTIDKKLEEEGFKVVESDWLWNGKAFFWYFVKDEELPEVRKHYGPPSKDEKHLQKFKEKWADHKIFHEGNRVYVEVKIKYTNLKDFAKHLTNSKYILNNVKSLKVKVY